MDFWTNPTVIFAGTVMCFIIIIMVMLKRKPPVNMTLTEERERSVAETLPKCVCGEIATDPAPGLKRGRGAWDWLRNLYGAPPRYTREVDYMRPPVFCRAHVHVADALLDKFVFGIRSRYSGLNAEIAGEAAGFEQEHLAKQVADSLTEKQKRDQKRSAPGPLRVVSQKIEDEASGV
jgi:hypothetical protein